MCTSVSFLWMFSAGVPGVFTCWMLINPCNTQCSISRKGLILFVFFSSFSLKDELWVFFPHLRTLLNTCVLQHLVFPLCFLPTDYMWFWFITCFFNWFFFGSVLMLWNKIRSWSLRGIKRDLSFSRSVFFLLNNFAKWCMLNLIIFCF